MDFHDLNRVAPNGSLVLPLSLAKLHGHQSPTAIYDFLKFFSDKIRSISVDVILLYTNGLYFNSDEISLALRISTTNQMVRHRQELVCMIEERREFTPQAFHFLPWDYVILNSDRFADCFHRLERAYESDLGFRSSIDTDLAVRGPSCANVRFVLEELAVTHLIRQRFVSLPTTLSSSSGWRLIAYAGPHLDSDVYIYKNRLLPMNAEIGPSDQLSRSLYNYQAHQLIDYKRLPRQPSPAPQVAERQVG
jgi:hypothetical protein